MDILDIMDIICIYFSFLFSEGNTRERDYVICRIFVYKQLGLKMYTFYMYT